MISSKVDRQLTDEILDSIRTDESQVMELLNLFDLYRSGRMTLEQRMAAEDRLCEEAETASYYRRKSDNGADASDYVTKESKERAS